MLWIIYRMISTI